MLDAGAFWAFMYQSAWAPKSHGTAHPRLNGYPHSNGFRKICTAVG